MTRTEAEFWYRLGRQTAEDGLFGPQLTFDAQWRLWANEKAPSFIQVHQRWCSYCKSTHCPNSVCCDGP